MEFITNCPLCNRLTGNRKENQLTVILLMWTFGRAPNNASKWEMGFNSVPSLTPSFLLPTHLPSSSNSRRQCLHQHSPHQMSATVLLIIYNRWSQRPLACWDCGFEFAWGMDVCCECYGGPIPCPGESCHVCVCVCHWVCNNTLSR
jgi:hypothetical protein